MKIENIDRKKFGIQVLEIIKGEGYTKSSFARKLNITMDLLNKIINNDSNDEEFIKCVNIILRELGVNIEYIMSYENRNNHIHEKYPKEYEILYNILDLYEIYYK